MLIQTITIVSATTPKAALEQIHIFAGLREEVIEGLAGHCRPLVANAGDLIVEENLVGREMYLIYRGRVRIVGQLGTESETLFAELGPGDFFGEMCLIECARRSASAVALEQSLLYSLGNADMHWLFKRWPEQFSILMLNIARDLCRRLRAMNNFVTNGDPRIRRGAPVRVPFEDLREERLAV
ncbi:MAG: hypothetical protein QOE70_3110 [Chthoniobacter sp.]|jgi:CRP-like cAMP-binding protein|nr:hypothetical protein [Chthoniobacter sp.]